MKYHFKTDQGIDFLTQEEADRLAGIDAGYPWRDLFEAITRGDFPSWMLKMQIMPFDDAETYRLNLYDLTKVWPHSDDPLQKVGRLTLNRNPTDFHTEIEQAEFEPNNIVAGIGVSPDKMLLARLFSYADAHRARLGLNHKQIPARPARCRTGGRCLSSVLNHAVSGTATTPPWLVHHPAGDLDALADLGLAGRSAYSPSGNMGLTSNPFASGAPISRCSVWTDMLVL